MIQIWQPRWHDRTVLVARHRIPCGADIDIEITQGAYKGIYTATNDVIVNSPIENLKCKNGQMLPVRAIPFDKLTRKEE